MLRQYDTLMEGCKTGAFFGKNLAIGGVPSLIKVHHLQIWPSPDSGSGIPEIKQNSLVICFGCGYIKLVYFRFSHRPLLVPISMICL